MDVAELLLHDEQRAQHEADRLFDAFMLVDQLVGPRVGTQAFVDPREGRVGDMIRRAPDPRFERGAGKPEGFSRTEDWPHISRHRVRTVPLKTGHSMRRLIKMGIADVALTAFRIAPRRRSAA